MTGGGHWRGGFGALVGGGVVLLEADFDGARADAQSFKKVVVFVVGHPERLFIGAQGLKGLQIGGRHFVINFAGAPSRISSARTRHLARPRNVTRSAAPSPCLVNNPISASAAWSVPRRRLSCAAAIAYGCQHPLSSLHVPNDEILHGQVCKVQAGCAEGFALCVDRHLDVDLNAMVGRIEVHCECGVLFIMLLREGQADRHEERVPAAVAQASYGQLRKFSRHQ